MKTEQQKAWIEERMHGETSGGFYRDGRIYQLHDGVEVDMGPIPEKLRKSLEEGIHISEEEQKILKRRRDEALKSIFPGTVFHEVE